MSDKEYFQEGRTASIRGWVLAQMLRGAGWAGLVLVGILLLIYAVALVGRLLPEQSRQTPDPMRGSLEQPLHPLPGGPGGGADVRAA